MYVYVYVYVCIRIQICTDMHIYVHICMCIYTYLYIYLCMALCFVFCLLRKSLYSCMMMMRAGCFTFLGVLDVYFCVYGHLFRPTYRRISLSLSVRCCVYSHIHV